MLIRKLIDALSLLHPLSLRYQAIIQVENPYHYRIIKRDTPVLMPGKDADELSFICKGLFKLYRYNEGGEEMIFDFFYEGIFMMLPVDFYDGTRNELYYISALHDSELLTINRAKMTELYAMFPEVKIQTDRIRSRISLRNMQHLNLLFTPALDRYVLFLKLYPNVARWLTEIDICRFLGISKKTLYRSKNDFSKW